MNIGHEAEADPTALVPNIPQPLPYHSIGTPVTFCRTVEEPENLKFIRGEDLGALQNRPNRGPRQQAPAWDTDPVSETFSSI
jgi:hypothetical protein